MDIICQWGISSFFVVFLLLGFVLINEIYILLLKMIEKKYSKKSKFIIIKEFNEKKYFIS